MTTYMYTGTSSNYTQSAPRHRQQQYNTCTFTNVDVSRVEVDLHQVTLCPEYPALGLDRRREAEDVGLSVLQQRLPQPPPFNAESAHAKREQTVGYGAHSPPLAIHVHIGHG